MNNNYLRKKKIISIAKHPMNEFAISFIFRAAGRNLVNYRSRNRPETHAVFLCYFLLWEPKIWIFWFFANFSKTEKSR
jgi:hypothetical protein